MEKNELIDRIKKASLTKKQKIIAEYFINHTEAIGNLSSLELAKEIGVSDASIIRFCRVIGYEGYSDLKNHLYQMLVTGSINHLSLAERMIENDARYKEGSIQDRFFATVENNIHGMFTNNNLDDFDIIANALVTSRKKYVLGLRGCKGEAMSFGRLLAFMLKNVEVITDTECTSISSAQDLEKEDAVFMMVFSRYYKIDFQYLELAKSRNAKIFIVTDDITGKISTYGDVVIYAPTESINFFHSALATHAICEYILTLIGRKTEFRNRIEERDAITEDQRV